MFSMAESFHKDAIFSKSLEHDRQKAALKGGNMELALSSITINKVLAKASHVRSLPAEFSRIFDRDTVVARSMLLSTQLPFIVPFHHEFHWLVLFVSHEGVLCADSSVSSSASLAAARMVAFINECYQTSLKLSPLSVPQQPPNTLQCGIHLLVNGLAMFTGESLPCRGVLDYDRLRPTLQHVLSGEAAPTDLLSSARIVAHSSRIMAFRSFSSSRCVKLLCIAPVGELVRFLIRTREGLWGRGEVIVPPTVARARALKNDFDAISVMAAFVVGNQDVDFLMKGPRPARPLSGGAAQLDPMQVRYCKQLASAVFPHRTSRVPLP